MKQAVTLPRDPMDEILPQLFHWTTRRETIGKVVSSYYVAGEAATLVDPMMPEGGVEAVAALGRPRAIVLTNRHHLRAAQDFCEAFECPIVAHEAGLHEFADGDPTVRGFGFGENLRPGIEALEVGAITPEETALHISVGAGALAFADAIVHYGDEISMVGDSLLGDDPEAVKRAVRDAISGLLARDFDAVLFAHGDPIPSDGRAALRRFVERGDG